MGRSARASVGVLQLMEDNSSRALSLRRWPNLVWPLMAAPSSHYHTKDKPKKKKNSLRLTKGECFLLELVKSTNVFSVPWRTFCDWQFVNCWNCIIASLPAVVTTNTVSPLWSRDPLHYEIVLRLSRITGGVKELHSSQYLGCSLTVAACALFRASICFLY